MTKKPSYRLEFSDLRVSRNHSPQGITLSGVMRNACGRPLPYDTLPFLQYGGITISTRELVDDRFLVMGEVQRGVHKYCLPVRYSGSFSVHLDRPDDGWDERYTFASASTGTHHVQVEGLDRLYDLILVLARMDATPSMPQIDTFDLAMDEFLQRMEPLLDELSVMNTASARCNLPTTHAVEPALAFTDVTVRESEPPTPSYDPYETPRARLEVCGTVTNVSQRLLPIDALPILFNEITFRGNPIHFGNGGLRQVEVVPGIWGSNLEPDQSLRFSYPVPVNPTYHLYDEHQEGGPQYSVQGGWRFVSADIYDQSGELITYPGLEEVSKQIEESLRRIHGADHSETVLFSDLIASGRNEFALKRLIQDAPYWIAPYSESSYAYHYSDNCPTLARSTTEAVDGYFIATSRYLRCSVCGR